MGLVDQQVMENVLKDIITTGRMKMPIPRSAVEWYNQPTELTEIKHDEITVDFGEIMQQMDGFHNRLYEKIRENDQRRADYGKLKYLVHCVLTGKDLGQHIHVFEVDRTDGCEICGCEDCVEGFIEWPRKRDAPEYLPEVYHMVYSSRCADHQLQDFERSMVGRPESPYAKEI